MLREIYLDNNATTKPLAEVRAAVAEALGDDFGNPSSSNAAGDRARAKLRQARNAAADLVGVDPAGLFFTSGGTEANNMVLLSAADHPRNGRCRVVTTTVEHSSVLRLVEPLRRRGVEVVTLPVDREGHPPGKPEGGSALPQLCDFAAQRLCTSRPPHQPVLAGP